MLAYRAEPLTLDEIAAEDPFGGQGMRIGISGSNAREDTARLIEKEYPGCSFVIFDSCAWIRYSGQEPDDEDPAVD